MQRLFSASPAPPLRAFVRGYAQRTYSLREEIIEPSLPCVEPVWSFLFGAGLTACYADGTTADSPRTAIVGPNLRVGTYLRLSGEVDLFAVFFLPAGFSDFFGVPLTDIVNTWYDATTVVTGASSLWHALADASSFAARVGVADAWLARQVAGASRSMDVHMANVVLRNRGISHIQHLAYLYGLSVRQFERRFSAAVGATPKSFSRVARFQSALEAKVAAPIRTWCAIAHEFGYFDQMHLVHDFQQLGGTSPQQIIELLGDGRPLAMPPDAGSDSTSSPATGGTHTALTSHLY